VDPSGRRPPPSTSSTLAAAGGRRRAKLAQLTVTAGLCLLVRPGAARLLLQVRRDLRLEQHVSLGRRVPLAKLDAEAAAPKLWMVGRLRWPRGWLGGQIWELEPLAAGSQLRAPYRRQSAPLCSPASVVVLGW
jgi:hypothetical protein